MTQNLQGVVDSICLVGSTRQIKSADLPRWLTSKASPPHVPLNMGQEKMQFMGNEDLRAAGNGGVVCRK